MPLKRRVLCRELWLVIDGTSNTVVLLSFIHHSHSLTTLPSLSWVIAVALITCCFLATTHTLRCATRSSHSLILSLAWFNRVNTSSLLSSLLHSNIATPYPHTHRLAQLQPPPHHHSNYVHDDTVKHESSEFTCFIAYLVFVVVLVFCSIRLWNSIGIWFEHLLKVSCKTRFVHKEDESYHSAVILTIVLVNSNLQRHVHCMLADSSPRSLRMDQRRSHKQ
jgi:hypothetical protein